MVAIDTNIVVRLLVNDDPAQTIKVKALFTTEKIYIPKTVILETEWVLRGVYTLDRAAINNPLRALLSLEQIIAEDETILFNALDSYQEGMDFADALHLASSHRATSFATFDAKFKSSAKKLSLKPTVISL
ncbi:MAG: type II toxin-antitoxin system VapC family toxin [Deltaproteobacteria bacterium]|nr:type II toxin-antitoxin system VapC family toxin [Deltaproteobacteria bacterium]